jgi:hypothetical protein
MGDPHGGHAGWRSKTAGEIVARLQEEHVDAVLLAPA